MLLLGLITQPVLWFHYHKLWVWHHAHIFHIKKQGCVFLAPAEASAWIRANTFHLVEKQMIFSLAAQTVWTAMGELEAWLDGDESPWSLNKDISESLQQRNRRVPATVGPKKATYSSVWMSALITSLCRHMCPNFFWLLTPIFILISLFYSVLPLCLW